MNFEFMTIGTPLPPCMPFPSVGLSNICYSDCRYSRSIVFGDFHPSGRMGKLL